MTTKFCPDIGVSKQVGLPDWYPYRLSFERLAMMRLYVFLRDSNLNHREKLLPSEKAFAYKLKVDATKRQGERSDLTSDQLAPKLMARDKVAENTDESGAQISDTSA